MRTIPVLIGMLLILVLAGCASPAAAPTPTPPLASVPQDPPDADSISPGESSSGDQAASGPVTYAIVPAESTVRYEVGETFINQNNRFNVAVGRTQEVEGTVTLDAANPQAAQVGTITIDISTFQSNEARRDDRIRREWLESSTYPIATFSPTEISGLPAAYTEGETITFQITGDLTIRDVTKPTTFDVTAALQNGELRGSASTQILMTDFGFDPPDIAGILQAQNEVDIFFDFVARPE